MNPFPASEPRAEEVFARLGTALADLRETSGLKQKELALVTGLSKPQVSRHESGYERPTLSTLLKYLDAVGANFVDLEQALFPEVIAAPALAGGLSNARRLAAALREVLRAEPETDLEKVLAVQLLSAIRAVVEEEQERSMG